LTIADLLEPPTGIVGPSASFSFAEYRRGLAARVALFAFLGLGWDVATTLLQMLLGRGTKPPPEAVPACACVVDLTRSAICPASAWMVLAYSGIPLLVYPVVQLGRRLRLHYLLRTVVVLAVFYSVELGFGHTMRSFGLMPWDYRWFLPGWSLAEGLVCYHPVIVLWWFLFCALIEIVDESLRRSIPELWATLKETAAEVWKIP
jgi:hypothetical protein